jgi:hypothetical protein
VLRRHLDASLKLVAALAIVGPFALAGCAVDTSVRFPPPPPMSAPAAVPRLSGTSRPLVGSVDESRAAFHRIAAGFVTTTGADSAPDIFIAESFGGGQVRYEAYFSPSEAGKTQAEFVCEIHRGEEPLPEEYRDPLRQLCGESSRDDKELDRYGVEESTEFEFFCAAIKAGFGGVATFRKLCEHGLAQKVSEQMNLRRNGQEPAVDAEKTNPAGTDSPGAQAKPWWK